MIKEVFLVLLLLVLNNEHLEATEQSALSQLNTNRNIKNLKSHHLSHPYYIDNSSICQILFFNALHVIKNCSGLNLAGSDLTFLSQNTMSVTELILSNNNFESSIPYTQINMYAIVRTLDLGHNLINDFNTEIRLIDCNLTCIKYLKLNHNRFSKIPMLSATCSNNLLGLNMSYNKELINIDQDVDTYPLMSNLENLDLAYCSIEYLNSNSIFKKMPKLIYLNMTGNRIKNIYPNPFLSLMHLEYLSFEPSLLQCNSSILWLKQFLQMNARIKGIWPNGTLSTRPYEPFCFNILTNQSQNIITSPNTSFYTGIYLSTSLDTRSIAVIQGKTLELDCEKYSVPASDLWWTFNDRVLSKSVNGQSPYEFIENFDQTNSLNYFNKTSVLRIKNIEDKQSGVYSCKAFYLNVSLNKFHNNIASIQFLVSVQPSAEQPGHLTGGQIAAIVVGSIAALLLLCLLLVLCIWCCCFKRGICCWCCVRKEKSENFSKNSLGYSSTTNSKKHLTEFNSSSSDNNRLDVEDNSSGFHDLSDSRPNYVISTISSRTGHNQIIQSNYEKRDDVFDSGSHVMIDDYPLTNPNRVNVYNVQSNNQFSTDYQSSGINSNLYANKSTINNGFLADDSNYGYRLSEAPIQHFTETTEYSSNHFVSQNDYEGRNEYRDEKMVNRVEYDANDIDQQYFMPDEYHRRVNAYQKYDSDV